MKVLCLNPPSPQGFIRTGRWTRKSRGNQSWAPIWLAYTTGLLQQHGFNVGLLDASIKGMSFEQAYLYITKVIEPDFVFYYWCWDNMEQDLAFADELAIHCRVVLVGPWSLCAPDALLKTKRVNIMTYGEFEHTALELLQTKQYTGVKGIVWRNHLDNTLHKNPPRPLCSSKELDAMPFVSSVYKEFLDLSLYHQTSFRYPFVDLLSARGCPYHCTYCTWGRALQNGSSYRPRSIENVIAEFRWIKENLPEIRQIHLQDDTIPEKRARDLSQALLDADLGVTWSCYSRAELSYDTLKLMKDSGLRTLHIGYETNDQKTLDLIEKDMTVAKMEEFAKSVQRLDLWTCAGFMIFPWQTKEEVHDLVRWVKAKIRPRRFSFTQLFAYPNTPICQTIQSSKHLLSRKEMVKLEKDGFNSYYLRNPRWWLDTLQRPSEWRNVAHDALGLLRFMEDKED